MSLRLTCCTIQAIAKQTADLGCCSDGPAVTVSTTYCKEITRNSSVAILAQVKFRSHPLVERCALLFFGPAHATPAMSSNRAKRAIAATLAASVSGHNTRSGHNSVGGLTVRTLKLHIYDDVMGWAPTDKELASDRITWPKHFVNRNPKDITAFTQRCDQLGKGDPQALIGGLNMFTALITSEEGDESLLELIVNAYKQGLLETLWLTKLLRDTESYGIKIAQALQLLVEMYRITANRHGQQELATLLTLVTDDFLEPLAARNTQKKEVQRKIKKIIKDKKKIKNLLCQRTSNQRYTLDRTDHMVDADEPPSRPVERPSSSAVRGGIEPSEYCEVLPSSGGGHIGDVAAMAPCIADAAIVISDDDEPLTMMPGITYNRDTRTFQKHASSAAITFKPEQHVDRTKQTQLPGSSAAVTFQPEQHVDITKQTQLPRAMQRPHVVKFRPTTYATATRM